MNLAFPSPEFDDAVAAVCHGTAGDAEMRALNELLRSHPGARDEYLLRVELHNRLASDPDLHAPAADASHGARVFGPAADGRRLAFPRSARGPWAGRTGRRWILALAAGVVLAAAGVWHFGSWPRDSRDGVTSTAVAMLTRAVDARWSSGSGPLRVGSALEPGWLRLESGLAQVVFYSGARVVIEGPAELRLAASDEAECPRGRLLAEVPPPARGFRVKTGELTVTDLGTAFGVDAHPGRTEVHVFQGRVELRPGGGAERSLSEGQAATAEGGIASLRLATARPAAFAPLFEFQQRSLASEAVRYDQWRFANARLGGDPSLLVHFDFEDLGPAEWRLRNAAAGTRSVPGGTIIGCRRAEGRWPEKQALEFQSINDRVRLDVPGEFDALTLAAWVCVKGLDRQFNSLFMCEGFEPGTVHWLIRHDGVLGLTVFGDGPGSHRILASPPVLSLDQFGLWLHLAVVLDGPAGEVVHYVNGSPVSRHPLDLHPPFRLGAAELGNWNVRSGPNPGPMLIRNFGGSLDEFQLFGRALSDGELRELHAHGKPGA
jgi:hypothetical protein